MDRMLKAFSPTLASTSVHWFTDNQADTHTVEVGSRSGELQRLAVSVFETCVKHAIYISKG